MPCPEPPSESHPLPLAMLSGQPEIAGAWRFVPVLPQSLLVYGQTPCGLLVPPAAPGFHPFATQRCPEFADLPALERETRCNRPAGRLRLWESGRMSAARSRRDKGVGVGVREAFSTQQLAFSPETASRVMGKTPRNGLKGFWHFIHTR